MTIAPDDWLDTDRALVAMLALVRDLSAGLAEVTFLRTCAGRTWTTDEVKAASFDAVIRQDEGIRASYVAHGVDADDRLVMDATAEALTAYGARLGELLAASLPGSSA